VHRRVQYNIIIAELCDINVNPVNSAFGKYSLKQATSVPLPHPTTRTLRGLFFSFSSFMKELVLNTDILEIGIISKFFSQV